MFRLNSRLLFSSFRLKSSIMQKKLRLTALVDNVWLEQFCPRTIKLICFKIIL